MDSAFCSINKFSYDIASFSKLDKKDLSLYRHSLICIKCDGQGYYRKKSIDGKPACFGAYHEENCVYKSKESTPRYDDKTTEEVNTIITHSHTIEVDFTMATVAQSSSTNNAKINTSRTPSSRSKQHSKKPIQHRNMVKGLRSLLRMLMFTDSFKSSSVLIKTEYEHPYQAKNLFVHFNDINEQHLKKWKGFWGVVSGADSDINWLNISNKQNVSINITKIKDSIKETFKVSSDEDLVGAAVLVFGQLKKSKKGKWYVIAEDPQHIVIRKNRG